MYNFTKTYAHPNPMETIFKTCTKNGGAIIHYYSVTMVSSNGSSPIVFPRVLTLKHMLLLNNNAQFSEMIYKSSTVT